MNGLMVYEEMGLSTLRFSIYEPNAMLCLFKLSRQTLAYGLFFLNLCHDIGYYVAT